MPGRDKTPTPYSVFTTKYDEVVSAAVLAARPVRVSQAIEEDDLRHGLLPEAEASAGAIASDLPGFDGTVQILLDMSGSNRGGHVETIRFVDVAARALEKAGIKFEVLGFTTSSWKGGKSREDWKLLSAEERSKAPGRLCDLRHVVFKEVDAGWDESTSDTPSAAALLDVLFRPPYLKENVDGEALRWAASRHGDGEVRMILFSDGAPCDDATLSCNPSTLLSDDVARALSDLADDGIVPTAVRVLYDETKKADEGVLAFVRNEDPAKVAEAILARALAPDAHPAPAGI